MTRLQSNVLAACAAACLTHAVSTAHGQPASAAPSDEDAAALEAALQADAATATPPPPTAAAPPASSGGLQSFIPDIAVIADVALAAFSDDAPLQDGAHDPVRNGFNLQQLELSIGASVDPYFRFDSNLVFSEHGVEIEEAYATTLDLPARLQLRAGQFLTRFGRINASHPHSWSFIDQPFAISRVFGGEGNRGLGVELSWLTPLPWYVELVGSSTMADGEETARSFFGAHDLGVESPADLLYVAALKQFFPLSDDWSLAWGLSAAFGPNSTGHESRTAIYGTDLFLKWRPIGGAAEHAVELHSEWFYRRRQQQAGTLQDLSGFAALTVRFDKRWSTGARYEYGSPSYDSELDVQPDDLDPEWIEPRHRVTALFGCAPTEFSRVRLQGSVDLPEYREAPIWAAMLGLEVAIGAHGAHSF